MKLLGVVRTMAIGAVVLVALSAWPVIRARAASMPSGPGVVPNSVCGNCSCTNNQCCSCGVWCITCSCYTCKSSG